MSNKPIIEHYLVESADKFMESLGPQGIFTQGYTPRKRLYRGHADASYLLLPSALRPNARLLTYYPQVPDLITWESGVRENNLQQVRAEAYTLLSFMQAADQNGLPIPEDTQQMRTQLKETALAAVNEIWGAPQENMQAWPPDNVLSLCALAQHYGVPTRLLDWTYHPYTAAYFAATGAIARQKQQNNAAGDANLCVWILESVLFDVHDRQVQRGAMMQPPVIFDRHLIQVAAPTASNPNLRAQQGAFLLNRPVLVNPLQAVDVRPFDVVLEESMGWLQEGAILTQISLPISESRRLLRLLALQGVTAATMFPGYDGVSKALWETELWETMDEWHQRIEQSRRSNNQP